MIVIEYKLTGTIDAAVFHPISNYTFTKALGKVFIVITASKEVYFKALETVGFVFKYPTIESSLGHILD